MNVSNDRPDDRDKSPSRMHPDEVDTNLGLVRRLLAAQFPDWADLPLRAIASSGTDNTIYRLGDDRSIRMPRIGWAVGQVQKEQEWLPRLAAHLPLAIPVPLALGYPGEGYPWHWSVYEWLDGENATFDRLVDGVSAAIALAAFILALQKIDATGGPLAGDHNFGRGVPIRKRDSQVREALTALEGVLSPAEIMSATAVWEAALNAPVRRDSPVWVHGDLQPGNLLAREGRLSAAIDFGGLGVGDPACDLLPAWNLFSGESREAFRAALGADDAMWARGRGWALSVGLIALPYYQSTNPAMVRYATHTITEVLAEAARSA